MIVKDDIKIVQDGKQATVYYKGELLGTHEVGHSCLRIGQDIPFCVLHDIEHRLRKLKIERVG